MTQEYTRHERLIFIGEHTDQPYLDSLRSAVGQASCAIRLAPVSTWTEVKLLCSTRGITGIVSTSVSLLSKLTGIEKPSLSDYAGSLFQKDGYEIVFVSPLEQIHTVAYARFLLKHYVSKLVAPITWMPVAPFVWKELTASNFHEIHSLYQTAIAVAVDIETAKDPVRITEIGYTAIFPDLTTHSCVLSMDTMAEVAIMRQMNSLPAPKITQNGKYDNSYLLAWNAPLTNWLWDTATMFHCTYSELPKDLASLGAFYVRNAMYWKDLADTDPLLYNCLDTWTTANVFLAWIKSAPEYAKRNYLLEFPLLAPCLLAEMTGIKRDMKGLQLIHDALVAKEASLHKSVQTMVGVPGFNPGSPKQMLGLLKALGCGDLTSSDEKNLNKAAYRHPLIARIVETVLDIRGTRKLISTYLTPGAEYNEHILYALNPHGTDTGRLASKEHHFWCGFNIQNIPRGREVKATLRAPDGWRLAEVDLEQAESRDTAHISGDESLISAVSGVRDFHSVNASAFFGFPYDDIYDDIAKKTKNKPLRDLAKRVNHGANYNMGPGVLVDTMGFEAIFKAASLLKLPKHMEAKDIAAELLSRFHKTYPGIDKFMYQGVLRDIRTTRMIVGATGWTRYCFKNPEKDKRAKNAYVAHPPQSLNAMMLNKAFLRVFYEIALNPEHSQNFSIIAQIHDSILFRFREGHHYLCELVRKCMENPVTVTGYDGKTRTFTVPAAIKAGKDGRGSIYWSETE